MSALTDLADRVTSLYKETVTTSVRFDALRQETKDTIAELKGAVQRFDDRLHPMHLDHVRERADLGVKIGTLDGRLTALSEQALHTVARDAAREAMRSAVGSPPAAEGDGGRSIPLPAILPSQVAAG